jgi:hypothetical protein
MGFHHTPVERAVTKTVTYTSMPGTMFAKEVTRTVKVCPECADHEHGDICAFHDCKNEFVEFRRDPSDGLWKIYTVGQCQCAGIDHGKRKDWTW